MELKHFLQGLHVCIEDLVKGVLKCKRKQQPYFFSVTDAKSVIVHGFPCDSIRVLE